MVSLVGEERSYSSIAACCRIPSPIAAGPFAEIVWLGPSSGTCISSHRLLVRIMREWLDLQLDDLVPLLLELLLYLGVLVLFVGVEVVHGCLRSGVTKFSSKTYKRWILNL